MMSPQLKVGLLCAFWVPYGYLPVHFGLFDCNSTFCVWEEVFRFIFAILGYGLIGTVFYAVTGPIRHCGGNR